MTFLTGFALAFLLQFALNATKTSRTMRILFIIVAAVGVLSAPIVASLGFILGVIAIRRFKMPRVLRTA